MQTVEEGCLQVTNPVSKFLPSIGQMKVGTEVIGADGKPVFDADTRELRLQFRSMATAALLD